MACQVEKPSRGEKSRKTVQRELKEEAGLYFPQKRFRRILFFDQHFLISKVRYGFNGYAVELKEDEKIKPVTSDPDQTHEPWEWVPESRFTSHFLTFETTANLQEMYRAWQRKKQSMPDRLQYPFQVGTSQLFDSDYLPQDSGVIRSREVINRLFANNPQIRQFYEIPDNGPI